VINFSDYGNSQNLFEKYFTKNNHNKTISFLFMRSIIKIFNRNLKTIFATTKLDNDLLSIRGKSLKNLNLFSLWTKTKTIKDLIEYNTFYNLVEKKTTNSFHSTSEFIKTIIENNNYLQKSENKGISISEICSDQLKRDNTSIYCRESLYYSIDLVFKDIFSPSNILNTTDNKIINEFNKVRNDKFLSKEFFSETMSERVYSRFSSQFLSKNKSLKLSKIDTEKTVKQRMIDTTIEYIDLIFGNVNIISPVLMFEKTFSMIEDNKNLNGVSMRKLCNICALSKKEQHESDREIYVLFIVTKILTVFIQSVFYVINSLVRGEMVVKPTINKINLIKDITKEIYLMSHETEIIFMNGDMASWSGRDIYDKFSFSIDCINSLGYIDRDVLNMTKFAFEMSSKMKIIVPDKSVNSKKYESDVFETDPYFGKVCIEYSKSWPQGIYHNPSSFIHACEQRIKNELLKDKIKTNFKHKFLDHSDDKNEIINLKLNDYEQFLDFQISIVHFLA